MIMAYGWKWWGCAVLLLSVAGCAVQPVPQPVPEPEPVASPSPPSPPSSPPPPVRIPIVQPPEPVTLPRVAIVVSMDIPAYNAVAASLERRLNGPVTRYLFDAETRTALEQEAPDQIVAIGLEAALLAKLVQPGGRPVVFCQVFNHVEHDLVTANVRGVSLFPSFEATFATWRTLAPTLREVAVFTGGGFGDVLAPAVAAAAAQGINLTHVSVTSDKELLYRYKRMANRLDGLWLLPDNRVLNRAAIQEIMSFSLRNGKQVAVFNEQLLGLGGLFSVTSDPDEVATKVVQRLAEMSPGGADDQPGLLLLEEAVVRINPVIAQRLNLMIPEFLLP